MKKLLLGVLMLSGLALANGSVNGQTFQNGPYYANPSWDQQIPAAQRFIVLSNWNNEAVLDRETGLVWQRTPAPFLPRWFQAVSECYEDAIGNRRGWRLPSFPELASLLDPTQTNPALPPGHPFLGVKFGPDDFYWTATTIAGQPDSAYQVTFNREGTTGTRAKTSDGNQWCVRGGSGAQNPQ
jgi:hypothetical protein